MALPVHHLNKRKGVRIIVADKTAETLSVVSPGHTVKYSSEPGRPEGSTWERKARSLLQRCVCGVVWIYVCALCAYVWCKHA